MAMILEVELKVEVELDTEPLWSAVVPAFHLFGTRWTPLGQGPSANAAVRDLHRQLAAIAQPPIPSVATETVKAPPLERVKEEP